MALRPRVIGGVPATPEEEAAAAAARSRWSCARCKRWCAGVLAVAAVLGVAYSRLAYGGPSGRSGGETWYRPSTWRDYAASRVPRNASARLAELEVWRGNATVLLSALERSNSRLRGRVDALEETVATLESPAGEPGLAAQMAAQNASLAAQVRRLWKEEEERRGGQLWAVHVKAHQGHEWNERADRAAARGSAGFVRGIGTPWHLWPPLPTREPRAHAVSEATRVLRATHAFGALSASPRGVG